MFKKEKKLHVPMEIVEDVLLLSSRLKRKDAPGKFYKSTVDKKSFFNKKIIFEVISRKKFDNK